MATSLEFKITDAGIAAAFNAESTGIDVLITHIAFGSGFKAPDGKEVGLINEIKRLPINGGSRILPDQVRISALWASDSDEAQIREIGVYAGSVLFAYSSRGTGVLLGTKNAGVDFAFYYNWALKDIPYDTVTVVVDPNAGAAMAALANHEADQLAHRQYLRRSSVAQEASIFTWAGLAGGAPDSITLSLPAESYLTSYRAGQNFKFMAQSGNGGPVSLNINGLGPRSVRKDGATALTAGDIVGGRIYEVTFDGANFQLQTATGVSGGGGSDGDIFIVHPFIATAGQTTFEVPYEDGSLLVFVRGDFVPPERFEAVDGVNVVLDAACTLGDEVSVVTFLATAAANVYTKPQTYSRAEVLALLEAKQSSLGFTPVQQGGGVSQTAEKVRVGGDGAGNLLAQVGNQPLGKFWTSSSFDPDKKQNIGSILTIAESRALLASEAGLVLVNASAGNLSISLPNTDGLAGVDFIIRRTDNAASRLVINASGTEKIKFHTHLNSAGYSFFTLVGAGDWWHLRSDGAGGWWPVGRMDSGPLGRPVLETTTLITPGGYGPMNGSILVRADWPWLWDHARLSGMLRVDAERIGFEGSWTSGNGTTTFRTPEVRGEFLRALDETRGVDASRVAGSSQGDAIRNITGRSSSFYRSGAFESVGAMSAPSWGESPARIGIIGTDIGDNATIAFDASKVVPTAVENRPRNIALPARMKMI